MRPNDDRKPGLATTQRSLDYGLHPLDGLRFLIGQTPGWLAQRYRNCLGLKPVDGALFNRVAGLDLAPPSSTACSRRGLPPPSLEA